MHWMNPWTCDQWCSYSWFIIQSNTWTAIANMLSRRSSAGVAVLDGMLYVAGGNDGTSCLNSVERFNPKTNTWEGVAPMNIRRLVHFFHWSFTEMVRFSIKKSAAPPSLKRHKVNLTPSAQCEIYPCDFHFTSDKKDTDISSIGVGGWEREQQWDC